nr:hypothetical protein [uncultured Pseudoxanthomonas sp.]
MSTSETPTPLKLALWSVLALLAGLWFWRSAVGNPLHDLALIRESQIAPGSLSDVGEFEEEDHRGRYTSGAVGIYEYTVNGKTYQVLAKAASEWRLTDTAEIEYLPDAPDISRVKGVGVQSIRDWFWRKIVAGLVLLGFMLYPGIHLAHLAIKDYKRLK